MFQRIFNLFKKEQTCCCQCHRKPEIIVNTVASEETERFFRSLKSIPNSTVIKIPHYGEFGGLVK